MIYKLKQLALLLLMLSIIGFTLSSANAVSIHSCEHTNMQAQNSALSSHENHHNDNLKNSHCEDEKQICDCDNCNCNSHLAGSVYIDLIVQNNEYSRHHPDNKVQIDHLYSQPFSNPLLRPPII